MNTLFDSRSKTMRLRTGPALGLTVLFLALALAAPRLADAQTGEDSGSCSEREAILEHCYNAADGYWERLECDLAGWLYLPVCLPPFIDRFPE
jgi:hypothetical protein